MKLSLNFCSYCKTNLLTKQCDDMRYKKVGITFRKIKHLDFLLKMLCKDCSCTHIFQTYRVSTYMKSFIRIRIKLGTVFSRSQFYSYLLG